MEYNLDNLIHQFRQYLLAGNGIALKSIKFYVSDIKYFFGWFFSPQAAL